MSATGGLGAQRDPDASTCFWGFLWPYGIRVLDITGISNGDLGKNHGVFYGEYGDIHGIWMGYFTLIRPVTNTMEISG